MISLIHTEVVNNNEWISASEFTDIIAISQMTPGPISINSATYIGYTATESVWGAVVAMVGVCTPSLIIMLILGRFYIKMKDNPYVAQVLKALRPVVIGLILSAALILFTPESFIDWKSYLIFGVTLVAVISRVNSILLITLAGVAGYLLY